MISTQRQIALPIVLFAATLSAICLPTMQIRAQDEIAGPNPPAVGTKAPDFELTSVDGKVEKLSDHTQKGRPVVLAVLRGYPGNQCPACSAQVADLLKHADALKKSGAHVLLVYPGASDKLAEKAREFMGDGTFPEHFTLLLDPDFKLTNAYQLRWDAPRETAYPSTFVISPDGIVRYALTSTTHKGRAQAADVVAALQTLIGSK